MKRIALLLALTASPALASADTDYPHRDWGQVATLDMTPTEATGCIARELARRYESTMPVPAEGGFDIDAGPGGGFFGAAHEPWLRYQVREEDGATTLRVFYRHPASRRWITRDVRRMGDRCLKVLSTVEVAVTN